MLSRQAIIEELFRLKSVICKKYTNTDGKAGSFIACIVSRAGRFIACIGSISATFFASFKLSSFNLFMKFFLPLRPASTHLGSFVTFCDVLSMFYFKGQRKKC